MYGPIQQYYNNVAISAHAGYPNQGFYAPTIHSMSGNAMRSRQMGGQMPWQQGRQYGRLIRPRLRPFPRRYPAMGQRAQPANAMPKQPGMVMNPYAQGQLISRGNAMRR